MMVKVIQSELGAFAKTIEGYLTGVGADRHLSKMPDVSGESQDENQQASYPTRNNGGYQQGNYSGHQQRNSNSGYQQRNNYGGYANR